ncbi:hypothetical protein HPP92_014190 [Vanilla planifolia]|uniref:Uncharacterized protein n=1 Tax=Vanilla planifolia TaxID=51239 RepID=A0A835QRF5_VANPL|nr:hypothetical protein HPP92_014190 [Vanilla planifolia]
MVLLDKLWDDVFAGPHPEKGLEKFRKISARPLVIKKGNSNGTHYLRSASMTATTSATPNSPLAGKKPDVWRSVFNPGSNINSKTLGADLFDRPQPNSPTVYDWLYSMETTSSHR